MTTLIVRAPSKAAADRAGHWTDLPCPFALLGAGRGVDRDGIAPLSALAVEGARARQLVVVLAASDVTLLQARVPPLSAAQLRRALPSLVEDQLLSDPAECVLAAGPVHDGVCTVAVVQRAWLELLARAFNVYGAGAAVAVPAQLCLSLEAGRASAAVNADEDEVTLRLSAADGIGVPAPLQDPQHAAVLATLEAIAPPTPVTLYVPAGRLEQYRSALADMPALQARTTLQEDDWTHWIGGAATAGFNLFGQAAAAPGARARWRLPLALAALALLVNVAGLNVEWWRLRQEATGLRAAQMQIYRAAFPQDTVIVDPLLQMQRKIGSAGQAAGEPAPNDFVALLARFGVAWSKAAPGTVAAPAIASLGYRERSLLVGLKPGNEATMTKLQPALAAQKLAATQTAPGAWQIRSVR